MRIALFLSVFAGVFVLGCGESSESEGNSSSSGVPSEISSSSNLSGDSSSSGTHPSDGESSSSGSSSSLNGESSSSGSSSSLSGESSSGGNSSPSNASSSSRTPSSSSSVAASSSSVFPPVPGQYERLTEANAQRGWASRYWDGCKPHCSHRENVDTTAVPFTVCRNCDANNKEIAAFTQSPDVNPWWIGYKGTSSSCESGGVAFTCFDMAPVKINDTLSYGFAAAPGSAAACGQCFQLQFDGGTNNGASEIKDAHQRIKGKTMIVLASNIGHDVAGGQFDILIPGGGVGIYDSFSNLLGVSKDDLGAIFGGFLTTCQQSFNDYNLPAARYKECVSDKCNEIFGRDAKFADLLRGCLWFADWYETADNPTYLYKKVDCPDYLTQKYISTIHTSKDTDRKAGEIY